MDTENPNAWWLDAPECRLAIAVCNDDTPPCTCAVHGSPDPQLAQFAETHCGRALRKACALLGSNFMEK